MEIVRKELTPTELSPPGQRYDETGDTIQITADGTTWTDAPILDARHSDVYRLPPLIGDAACDAAARIVAAWQETLDIFFGSVSAAQFGTLMMELLLALLGGTAFLGPIGLLIDLVIIVFYALIAIGQETIAAAFTTEVWDAVLCIVATHIDSNGQISSAQRDAIMSDINAAYPGTVFNVLTLVQQLFGEVLMSNAGVERDETGDCSNCFETCHVWTYPGTGGEVGDYLIRTFDTGIFEDEKTLPLTSIDLSWNFCCAQTLEAADWKVTLYWDDTESNVTTHTITSWPGSDTIDSSEFGVHDMQRIHVTLRSNFVEASDYPTMVELTFHYGEVPAPFGWAAGENCS